MSVKNVCNCPNPPGGSVECEPHQLAMCGVIDGVPRRVCLDPPTDASPTELVNWALEAIGGPNRFRADRISTEELRMIKGEELERADGGVIRFSLPESVREAIRALSKDEFDGGYVVG